MCQPLLHNHPLLQPSCGMHCCGCVLQAAQSLLHAGLFISVRLLRCENVFTELAEFLCFCANLSACPRRCCQGMLQQLPSVLPYITSVYGELEATGADDPTSDRCAAWCFWW
jgi:hypothetical protein